MMEVSEIFDLFFSGTRQRLRQAVLGASLWAQKLPAVKLCLRQSTSDKGQRVTQN